VINAGQLKKNNAAIAARWATIKKTAVPQFRPFVLGFALSVNVFIFQLMQFHDAASDSFASLAAMTLIFFSSVRWKPKKVAI